MTADESTTFIKYKFNFLLIIIGIIVYFNSLFGAFVWDDVQQIQNNYMVHSISNITSFFLGSTFAPQGSTNLGGLYYRPMMTTAFSVIYTFFGQQTFYYHSLQLLIHIVNSLLLFYLLKRFFKELLAFSLSLVFLIHPMNVESVSYISTLGEPLFFFFGIIAFILFQKGKLTIKKSIIISILILLSLFSKETGILFGLLIIIYYFIFSKKSLTGIIKTLSIIIAPISIYLFIRFFIAKVNIIHLPDVPMMTAPLEGRIFTMPAIFWFYIKTFFFPMDLYIYQEWMIPEADSRFFVPLVLDILFLALICILGFWIWRTSRGHIKLFIFFVMWLLMGVGFHLQLLPLDMTVADHMFYFPMIGLLGIIGICLQNIKIGRYNLRNLSIYLMIIIVCILSLRTIIRNTNWYDGLTLYSNDLRYERNDRIENLLAGELVARGNLQEARKHYESLLLRNPNQPPLIVNLAIAYEPEGNFQKAETTYQNGLRSDDYGVIYLNYGRILLKQGKLNDAKKISNMGISRFPNNSSLLVLKAITNYKLGDKQTALQEIQKAKGLSPDTRIDQLYQAILNDKFTY